MDTLLRPPASSDLPAMLTLNNSHAVELGELTPEALSHLVDVSFRTLVTETNDAFLIALEQGADYTSPNYRWFSERFRHFVYIDRVAVAANARRKGLARTLYFDLIEAALRTGHNILACEVNSDPSNPASDTFHAGLGFKEIGQARIEERGKTVRYLIRPLREDWASSVTGALR